MHEPNHEGCCIVENMTALEYNQHPFVRSSHLKHFIKLPTPAHVKHAIDNEQKDTEAFAKGRLLHALLLEPEKVDSYFAIEYQPMGDKTKLEKNGGSKEAWERLKAESASKGIPIIPYDWYETALGMAKSIEANGFWRHIGRYGRKELSLFTQLKNQWLKVRYDVLYGSLILDIKSTKEHLTDRKIRSIIAEYSYHFSAAMYLEVGRALGLDVDRFVWVFVENKPPYAVRFVEATLNMLAIGRREFYYSIDKLAECNEFGWPGYEDEISSIDLPDYYLSPAPILPDEVNDEHNDNSTEFGW